MEVKGPGHCRGWGEAGGNFPRLLRNPSLGWREPVSGSGESHAANACGLLLKGQHRNVLTCGVESTVLGQLSSNRERGIWELRLRRLAWYILQGMDVSRPIYGDAIQFASERI